MKRIRLILILIISLFLIGGCDETIDCGKNPEHESCVETIDCEKNPDHESCIDEVNYKEIEFDINLVRTEKYSRHPSSRYSNFERIFQNFANIYDNIEIKSVPILKFHEIEDKYIAVYINKNFMLKMKEIVDKKHPENVFKEKYLDEYFRMYDYNNNYIDDNGNEINKDTCPLKFYEVDKNKEIYNEYEGLGLLTLIGNRAIEIVDDLYIKETIGHKEVIYFNLYGTIENNIIKVDEDYIQKEFDRYLGNVDYNDKIREASSEWLYIYTGEESFEEGIYEEYIRNYHLAQIFELDGVKYLLVNETLVEDKDGLAALTKVDKAIMEEFNEELSRQATYELYFKKTYDYRVLDEEQRKIAFEEYLSKNGYMYEVYDYKGIIEKVSIYGPKKSK